jgi:murein DD-endopeptidase MepM/ murein hydrolase activator NlpD
MGIPDAPAPAASTRTDTDLLRDRQLLVPVPAARVTNTFDEARDGGARRHNAIDLMAPRGTPILSADAGRVLRMSKSSLGGITLYATDEMERFVYYYAHMDGYYPAMTVGRRLAKGDTIGFVGTTGNAPENAPHLHFQIMRMPADGKYWIGEPINPFPLLRAENGSTQRLRPERPDRSWH